MPKNNKDEAFFIAQGKVPGSDIIVGSELNQQPAKRDSVGVTRVTPIVCVELWWLLCK